MTWELFVMGVLFAGVCGGSIVGAYWFAERAVRCIQYAWARAQRIQDDAWDRMNKERTIWVQKLNALVQNNVKLTELNNNSARREIVEAQRYMEVTRQDIIKGVSKVVSDKLAQHVVLKPDETTHIPGIVPPAQPNDGKRGSEQSVRTPEKEYERRVTPTNV